MACFLYRVFDAEGQLLYVGISQQWQTRLNQHSSTSPWYQYVEDLTVYRYRDRVQARIAEDRALKAESPLWNKDGNSSGGDAAKAYDLKRWEERGQRLGGVINGRPPHLEAERERQFEERLEHDLRISRLMRRLSVIPGDIPEEGWSDLAISDPARVPALKRAVPAGAVDGSTEVLRHPRAQQMLMTDGSWEECEVIAQARDRWRGWRVLVRWYAPGTQREDWMIYEDGKFREPQD